MTEPHAETTVSFAEALRFWFKLGWISFGGPAGQIAIMHRELVEQRRWISEDRFMHALNFCMLLPGPEAQQLATYIGWLKHRTAGAVAAGLLFILPGFAVITVLSVLYVTFNTWAPMQGVLFGLKAAVLAVVVDAVVRIARRALKGPIHWLTAGVAFIAIFAFGVPFPIIILAAALLGFFIERSRAPQRPEETVRSMDVDGMREGSGKSAVRVAGVCLILWFAPLLLVIALLGPSHILTLAGVFFSKMAVVTFGGAYAVLAYVAQEAVESYEWLSAGDMMQGLALAETTPGPLILVLTFVGFVAAYHAPAPFDPITAGLLGATLTTWVTFAPSFMWILLGAPHLERLRRNVALSAAMTSVTAAVVGVILNLAVWFGLHALFGEVTTWERFGMRLPLPRLESLDIAAALIAVGAMIALLRFKTGLIPTLLGAAAAGLLARAI